MKNTLRVTHIDGLYYVLHKPTEMYYFECYRERWSATSTVIGLHKLWEYNPELKTDDTCTLFKSHHTSCRLCRVEANYIENYGRDSIEVRDEKARLLGFKYRIDFQDGTPSLYFKTTADARDRMLRCYPDVIKFTSISIV